MYTLSSSPRVMEAIMYSPKFVCHFVCYLLGKGGYVFGIVNLFVCLSVDNITQKFMNGLG